MDDARQLHIQSIVRFADDGELCDIRHVCAMCVRVRVNDLLGYINPIELVDIVTRSRITPHVPARVIVKSS
jgi:hypothetical protein